MRNTLIFLICFISALFQHSNCLGQSKTVNLKFQDSVVEKKISLRFSIQGLINYAYEPYLTNFSTTEDNVSFSIPDSIPFFMMDIESTPNYHWGKNVIMSLPKGQDLTIYLDSVSAPSFEGKRANLYQFVFDLKNGTGNERSLNTLEDFIKDKSTNSFFTFMDREIKTGIEYLDGLLSTKEIDKGSYQFSKNILIDDYLFRSGNIGLMADDRYTQKMDSITFYSDLDKIFKHYTIDFEGGISLGNKASLRKLGLISGEKLDLGFDYNYAETYLSRSEQEITIASEIITEVAIGQIDSTKLFSKRSKYKEVFPNSKYKPILDQLKIISKKDHYLGSYSSEKGFEEFGRFETSDLSKITGMFMGPKPVFVDFWATWCGPCIKEFGHTAELHEFLKENNIGIIYVSVDFPGAYDKWREMIVSKKLEGLHYFGTPEFTDKLAYLKGSTIPRYVLLDKDGTLLIERCEFPSSGKLIPQLKEVLKL